MNPEQPQPNQPPTQPTAPPPPLDTPTVQPRNRSIKGPLLLMFTPGILLACAILTYAFANTIMNGGTTPRPGEASPFQMAVNIILFITGGLSFIGGVPCFIGGLVWLVKRRSNT